MSMTATQPTMIDLMIRGRIVTMVPGEPVIEAGAVAVRSGDIVAVGTHAELARHFAPAKTIGDADAVVMPGLIDAHTHCTQCFVRSLTAGELPMIPRLYNPAQRMLDGKQAGATVRLLAAQLIASGVTTLCEGTLNPAHEEPILEALETIGIRAVMARGCADQDFHHAALYTQNRETSWARARPGEAEADLRQTDAMLRRYPPDGPQLIRAAVNASALLGFSADYFQEGAALARQHGATLQVHVGRDREEVEFCLAVWGRRPIERLADLGVVDRHLVAVHAVLASEREIELLAEGGAALAHSPIECVANMNGVPNLPRFRRAGIRVALGCDNQANDMFVNMRACWLLHAAKWGLPAYDPEFLTAREVLAMATTEAAEVLRLDDRVGTLEPGKAADLVVLDGRSPHLLASHDLPTEIVRYASRGEVRQTIVDGRILFDRGCFSTIDIERLRHEAMAGADVVRDVVAPRRYRPLTP
jgi:5-methylthioadenosine/S-adenosylhomocysteine deaminase